ncbi:MAG: HypC/HybG/HupF family hydrogenase formation chaperone [Proteobacteria bacterium]|nr:HypC/HybG/HupF family hydrogenase formation chaperone [Pseudomonadota bacterium]
MCVAIPSRITEIENMTATIDMDGALREVSIILLEEPRVGDYVLVHAGYAIQKIDEETAKESLKILKDALKLG